MSIYDRILKFKDTELLKKKYLYKKYAGVPIELIHITELPCFLFDTEKNKVLTDIDEEYILKEIGGGNHVLEYRECIKTACVNTYTDIPKDVKDNPRGIVVYPHNVSEFRFILIDEILKK